MIESSIEIKTGGAGWQKLDINPIDALFPPTLCMVSNQLVDVNLIEDVRCSLDGQKGKLYEMYFLNPEAFDCLTLSALTSKMNEYIEKKILYDALSKDVKELSKNIKQLLSDNDLREAKTALGSVSIKETDKVSYEDEAIEYLKNNGLSNLVKETVDMDQLKLLTKSNPDLKKKLDSLAKHEINVKLMYQQNLDESLKAEMTQDNKQIINERKEAYINMFDMARDFDDGNISISTAQEFTNKLQILKNEYQNNINNNLHHVKEVQQDYLKLQAEKSRNEGR